ncbi:geranyl transferase [Chromatiales bacterium (ex Bugula neritina AB1)]|nr:geranyl transferase [Chromatiales bacterium (ex Bugula neritina AB1)]
MSGEIQSSLAKYRTRVDSALTRFLPALDRTGTSLEAAMHYATLNGGKRVRPTLVYSSGKALGASLDILDSPACAIELMHAYSLVHDDLPSMDDDDLRRGKPTCHIKFGEAAAILAGDALQALAFTSLAMSLRNQLPAERIIDMINELGTASGIEGMAAGQAIDLEAVGQQLTLQQLEQMHQRKTGALISASVVMGAMCSEKTDQSIIDRLRIYGNAVGLSFQIADDILDIVADTTVIGKPQGADIAMNKPTFPSILGLDGARKHAEDQRDRALDSLSGFNSNFDELRSLATFVVSRSN